MIDQQVAFNIFAENTLQKFKDFLVQTANLNYKSINNSKSELDSIITEQTNQL